MRSVVRPAALLAAALAAHAGGALAQSRWARTYGGPAGGEFVHAAREMPGGDLVLAASTDSFGTGTGDGWLIRLDAAGTPLFESCAGSAVAGGVDGAVILDDGGAIFSSRDVRDPFLLHDALVTRVAPDGSVAWSTRISSDPGRYFLNGLVATPDGGVFAAGQASESDAGPFVGFLVKLAADGSVTWQRWWGGVIGEDLSFDAAEPTADGGFVLTGWMTGGAGASDLLVAKADAGGSIAWAQRLGGLEDDHGEGVTELAGGGYAVAGWSNSFTASGHSAWVLGLDALGRPLWTHVMGDAEWLDLQAVSEAPDGDVVVLGRIGDATNDLWCARIAPDGSAVRWQRRYQGDSGDMGAAIVELSGGDRLLAGTWAWGFPGEDLWALRTGPDGLMDACAIVHDTFLVPSSPRVTRTSPLLPPYPPLSSAAPATSIVASPSALTTAQQCPDAACVPLTCDAIVVDPQPACEGAAQSITLVHSGGVAPIGVTWDLDGDGLPDASGNPVVVTLPAGSSTVSALAADGCLPGPQSCSLSTTATVLSSAPPAEVSDVVAGATPLLVAEHGDRLSFEDLGTAAAAYNLYAGALGTWYAPAAACRVAVAAAGAGRLETVPAWPSGSSWCVVTASTRCAEGGAGRTSFGVERMSQGTWSACGPAP